MSGNFHFPLLPFLLQEGKEDIEKCHPSHAKQQSARMRMRGEMEGRQGTAGRKARQSEKGRHTVRRRKARQRRREGKAEMRAEFSWLASCVYHLHLRPPQGRRIRYRVIEKFSQKRPRPTHPEAAGLQSHAQPQ